MNISPALLRKTLMSLTVALAATTLSSCSATVALEPAPLANDPKCAEVSVRLPATVAGLEKRATNAQATSAWGKPTSVILRCGLEAVYASQLVCVTAADVDWLVDASKAPSYRFISFGRNPATEVIVDSKAVSGSRALEDLALSISAIKQTRRCTGN